MFPRTAVPTGQQHSTQGILPTDIQCQQVIAEMTTFTDQLTDWENEFVVSNKSRTHFTDLQKERIKAFGKKYVLNTRLT